MSSKLATKLSDADRATPPLPAPIRKGERTRRHLIAVARQLMERDGYLGLRVTDVAQTAKVSTGVFYIYFRDKEEIALCAFREICETAVAQVYEDQLPADSFEAVRTTIGRFAAMILDSGQIMRAVRQMLDQLPEARAIWLDLNEQVARRVARALERRDPGAVGGEHARIIYAHAAQAMIDTMLLNLVSYRQPDFVTLAHDRERMIEAFAIMWFRLVYGRNPDPSQCPSAPDFLSAR